ncbi:sperm-associated antigen 8-like [Crotalus tigris]|uniref:sperm-associated antigen 8-like n=1 Tax=Crotalus tigris TaxID=88082 RepID=UPI00192FAA2D|nr:sperm-associated antigen 8-like [Crotalus tigris]
MEPEGAQVPSGGEAAQSSTEEPRGSPAETAPCPAEMPPEPEAEPQAGATVPVELPPCHGVPGPYLGELPAADLQPLPLCVPEPPREPPTRGQCLMHNWQEERATKDLDLVPRPECGTEGSFHRHGHPGLLTLDFLAGMPTTTTLKDSYPRPMKTGLPVRGKREAMMEHLLYQKHRTSLLASEMYPPPEPMESLSITHRDYKQEGFRSVPLPPTQPHDYRLEQPQTFWLEHAQQVPGISSIRTGDTPFRKCATFTTPMSEYLDQPLPYSPENYPKL